MLTLTTAAEDRTLLTLAELRAAVGITDGSYTAALTGLNDYVAETITRACAVAAAGANPPTLRSEVLSETFRQDCGARELVLSRRPLVSIASVTEAGVALSADEYESDDVPGLLYRLSSDDRIYWPPGKIVVAYTAGWATVPAGLKLAATKLARTLWFEDGPGAREPGVKRVRTDGVDEVEYWVPPATDAILPQEVLDLLVPYTN